LAVQLHVSRQTVHAIEASKYDPSLPLAFSIARLFELKIEDIFTPELPESQATVARPTHRDFID
jgi:putative transcriptional regulator